MLGLRWLLFKASSDRSWVSFRPSARIRQYTGAIKELRYHVEMESRALLSSLRYRQQGTLVTLVSLSLCEARSVSGVHTRTLGQICTPCIGDCTCYCSGRKLRYTISTPPNPSPPHTPTHPHMHTRTHPSLPGLKLLSLQRTRQLLLRALRFPPLSRGSRCARHIAPLEKKSK